MPVSLLLSSSTTRAIGIFGGTFDPIHYGHLAIVEEVRYMLGLESVYVIPAAHQPLKQGQHMASPSQRYDMVCLACQGNHALIPSDLELHRPPPSYTIDTLHTLHNQYGDDVTLWFIMGSDALSLFPRWHAADQILALAHLAIVARPGSPVDTSALDAVMPNSCPRITTIVGPQLDIASSTLRQRLMAGQPVRYQLPDSILAYIQEHNLYVPIPSVPAE